MTVPRFARRLPLLRTFAARLDALRRERDRLLQEREQLRTQNEELRRAARSATAEPRVASSAPSFVGKLAETERQRVRGREVGLRETVWSYNDKLSGRAFAQRLGIAVPELLWTDEDVRAVPWETLPERFVVKPVDGTSSRGVFPLVREDGRLRCLFAEEDAATPEAVERAYRQVVEEGRVSAAVLVEQLLGDPHRPAVLPTDWKLYCFGGRVEVVLQRQPRASRSTREAGIRFWDRAWHDLGPIRYADQVDEGMPGPLHPQRLVEVAERIAAALPRPFVRIDLYDVAEGVRFGEITPGPGGDQWFGPEWDRRLGERWEAAEFDLWIRQGMERIPASPRRRSRPAGGPAGRRSRGGDGV
jgi:hypothetical protein